VVAVVDTEPVVVPIPPGTRGDSGEFHHNRRRALLIALVPGFVVFVVVALSCVIAGLDVGKLSEPGWLYQTRWAGDRARTVLLTTYAFMGVLLAGYFAFLIVRGPSGNSLLVSGWGAASFELAAGALCLTRGVARSIPKLIAVDPATGRELFNWGPRPAALQESFYGMRSEGLPYDVIKEELQRWYNKDKTATIQRELAALAAETSKP